MPLDIMKDEGAALGFVRRETIRIHAEVYRKKYPAVQYRKYLPIDTTGPEWIGGVEFRSSDHVGRADWQNVGADDVPRVETSMSSQVVTVNEAAIGYGWNDKELAHASMYGIPLTANKAEACRDAAERMIDRVAFLGDATKGLTGVANDPSVTVVSAPAGGNGTEWADKTPNEVITDVNAMLTGIAAGTGYTAMADTLVLPYAVLADIGTRSLSDLNQMPILDWIKRNNIYTMTTGQPLNVVSVIGMETAGAGGVSRAAAYRNSREVLELILPMPFKFWPVWRTGPWRYEIPGLFRLSGVNFKLPKEAIYMDGI